MTCDAPVLSISRVDSSTVRLSWTAADPGDVSAYNLYRDTEPYQHYYPDGVPYQVFANPGATMFDDAILGNATTNYFYALRAVRADGGLSEPSGQVGKFEFQLYETTGTDWTWITIPLDVSTLLMASDLATHIENNSSAAVSVKTISKWNAAAQSTGIYFDEYESDDFVTRFGYPYKVEVDVAVGSSVTWPFPVTSNGDIFVAPVETRIYIPEGD